MTRWGERRYYSLDYYLKETFGGKLYKLALSTGCTCPNRDGKLGRGGCIFCAGGSGEFASSSALTVRKQLLSAKELIRRKYAGGRYIAYFQSYTNTYAPTETLRELFEEAISDPEVSVLSVATRPDCLPGEVMDLLTELNEKKPVWIELGLQTSNEATAKFIRRGYSLPVFTEAVKKLHAHGIKVIAHVILFLPGETEDTMLATIDYLNTQPIDGVKLHLLHVLRGTDLANVYEAGTFTLPSMEEYFAVLGRCVNRLRPDIVIHRLTGDGPKELLIAPLWTGDKRNVLNQMQHFFKEHDIYQGSDFDSKRSEPPCQKL